MVLAIWYQTHKKKWWALPLVLPSVLLPLALWCTAQTVVEGHPIFLVYMPLALMTAFIILFRWAALPGMVVALFLYYVTSKGVLFSLLVVPHFILPVTLSWAGYCLFVPHRNSVISGGIGLAVQRMFWLILFNTTLFLLIYQVGLLFGCYDNSFVISIDKTLYFPHILINFQALLTGGLTGIPFFYLIIRILTNPNTIFSFWSKIRAQMQPGVLKIELLFWASMVILLVGTLLLVPPDQIIFNINYTLVFLLPVMLWGAMRFGFLLISNVWVVILILLCNDFADHLSPGPKIEHQLMFISSCYVIFSVILYLMAVVTTRQRSVIARTQRKIFIDPVAKMANIHALDRDIVHRSHPVLVLLHVPQLELLCRHYGSEISTHYQQQLIDYLHLERDEQAYHLSGNDLALLIHDINHRQRVTVLDQHIKQFRLNWQNIALQPPVGISYCRLDSSIVQLSLLLVELGTMADLSLVRSQPENLYQQESCLLQGAIKSKVVMMNRLQAALDKDDFLLMTQWVEGIRGDRYREITLRLRGEDSALLMPESFMPIADECGLSAKIDQWVLEKTFIYINKMRARQPGCRVAIKLTQASLNLADFAGDVKQRLAYYSIEPWQIIFETMANPSLKAGESTAMTLTSLRNMGCSIAIEGFGCGYVNYLQLKEINIDILKIDGRFIANMLSSRLDFQIVESICQLARVQKIQLVAENVETQAISDAVQHLGIDYEQGAWVGSPHSLEWVDKLSKPITPLPDTIERVFT